MYVQISTCQHFDIALLVEFIVMVGTLPVKCVPSWCLTLSLLPVCRLILGAETKSLLNEGVIAKHVFQCSQEQLSQVELQELSACAHCHTSVQLQNGFRSTVCVWITQSFVQHTQSYAYGKME